MAVMVTAGLSPDQKIVAQVPARSPPTTDDDMGRQTLIALSLDPQLVFLCASVVFLCIVLCSRHAFCGRPWRSQRRRRSTPAAAPAAPDLESAFSSACRRGLSEEMIKGLPASRFSEAIAAAGNVECAVCLGEFEDGDELRTLPLCGHAFHAECIDRWLRSQATCPLCRAAVLCLAPLFSGRIRQFPAEVFFIDAAWPLPHRPLPNESPGRRDPT